MRLLVGLGNPGLEHTKTRHNAGFVCVEAVAKALGDGSWRPFKEGQLFELHKNGEKLLLYKPMQFMNNSGLQVRKLVDFFQLSANQLAVALDDVYIRPGSARLRQSGGDGGHNGLKSLLDHLDDDAFWRIKLGAGIYEQALEHRSKQLPLDEYVLQRLHPDEKKRLNLLIDKLVPNLVEWLCTGTGLQEETVHL